MGLPQTSSAIAERHIEQKMAQLKERGLREVPPRAPTLPCPS